MSEVGDRSPRSRRSRSEELRVLRVLAGAGADRAAIEITSREVGARLGASQQAADRYLLALERQGDIARTLHGRRPVVSVTTQGIDVLRSEFQSLRRIFEGPARIDLKGVVVSGLGEGRYYLTQPGYAQQFPERIGYVPFPGTLNVRLEGEMLRRSGLVRHWAGIRIEGFQASGRTFGGATCIRARIERAAGHLIRPDRTHYEDVVEFIAPASLRETLHLSDLDPISVELEES
ncbi:MAG: DUF120 domain-containing protein [Thermoplasmata archaeon]